MQVKKFSGELVEFDIERFRHSLSKSGASEYVVEEVLKNIQPLLFDGISTREMYKLAFRLLRKRSSSFAARYSLKRALRELGPAGYHFEKWVAALFESMGYRTVTGRLIDGRAVSHEADVIACKGSEMLLAECKFRNAVDARISVTTPMYFLSRFRDLQELDFDFFGQPLQFTQPWLITNAYMTSDSVRFAEFYGINLLSWDYPEGNSIKQWVDNGGLYPLTCLTTLSKQEKENLMQRGCILVKDLIERGDLLDMLRLSPVKKTNTLKEAEDLVAGISNIKINQK